MGACTVTATVEEATVDEGRQMVDAMAKDLLAIDRVEFLRRLDSGAYDDSEDENVLRLVMLAPFAR